MSSNLYNKALKNVKFRSNTDKVQYHENEMSDNLKNSFNLEFNSIVKSIEQRKLQRVVLFEFLSKYDGNMPESFFYRNVMRLGEILMKFKYWMSANNECYERYLISVFGVCVDSLCCDIENSVMKCLGDVDERLELTVCALFGVCRAQFGNIESIDPLFESDCHRVLGQNLLRLFQKTMEMIVAREKYCWLIYNGTVHIYEICQKLIRCQQSSMAVEPLIWASCCLETSVPLLTIANLKWRATLYSAVCQAFYNCGQDSEAERFARRGLFKINELNILYEMSSESSTIDNSLIITEATIKMAVMIFKRAVFEIRRRPKTYLRPKTKVNFKELLQGNWPRTGTERLLAEMFESPSQQALAIVEAIKQPTRPLCKIGSPAPENDWDILDVYAELFYACTAIITGRSSVVLKGGKGFIPEFKVVNTGDNDDQITLSVRNASEVTVTTVFDMVCWAFTYANWEFIDVTMDPLLALLKESKSTKTNLAMLSTLQLLTIIRRAVLSSKLDKKSVKLVDQMNEDEKVKDGENADVVRSNLGSVSSLSKDTKSSKSKRECSTEEFGEKQKTDQKSSQDPLYQLAEFLSNMISNEDFDVSLFSKEILIESGIILWSKCKSILHLVQDGSLHSKSVLNISSPGKWIYILAVVHRLFTLTNYAQLNPVAYSEISLRLAILLEDISTEDDLECVNVDTDEPSLNDFLQSLQSGVYSRVEKCLLTAKDILKASLKEMDKFRGRNSMNESHSIKVSEETSTRNNSLDDIYLELNSLYFRVSVKSMTSHICARKEDGLTLNDVKKMNIYKDCLGFCNKNNILKAIFYSNVARQMSDILSPQDVEELSHMARLILEKVSESLSVAKVFKANNDNPNKLPPPIVIERGSDCISVKIDEEHISEELKEKIGWIRLYGRAVDSPNAEVRLTDDKLIGTGLETSSLRTVFTISNLSVNEQYILAFAAFDKFGSMIGRGMGHSTKKVLATDTMSIITASTLIAQIFYEIGLKNEVIRYETDLWNHFMEPLAVSTTPYNPTSKPPLYLHHNYQVKKELLATSSAMLLRQFCLLVMSSVDCRAKLNLLDTEPTAIATSHVKEQLLRINLCDKLLAMFTISKKLKNHILSLELFASVVHLTIAIINHNQFYEPFIQILLSSITTLHSSDCIPQTTWIKIPQSFKSSLHHMIASVGFYLLKYYNRYEPTNEILDSIRNSTSILLQMSSDVPFTISEKEEGANHSNITSRQDHAHTQKQAIPGKKTFGRTNKSEGSAIANLSSHQLAFEAYKYTMVVFGTGEHSLTGTDEPDVLLTYIANLPSKLAYKEVIKFAKKTRYLQFAVEVICKSMVEGNLDQSITMYKDIREWLRKRNESILGRSVLPPPSQMNVESKKTELQEVTALKELTVIEDDDLDTGKTHLKKIKKAKYKAITVTATMNEAQKQQQEELELKAITVLGTLFPQFYKRSLRRRKFRQVSQFEISSRMQLNSSIAMSFLGIAQTKIDALIQMLSAGYNLSDIKDTEDVTKYMLNETGQILSLTNLRGQENHSATLKITKSKNDSINDRPRTFRPEMKLQEKRLIAEAPKLLSLYLDNLNKAAVLFKKAIVLSERGKHWLLLSRACSQAWYALTIVTNISVKFENFINKAKSEYPDIDWSPIKPVNLKDVFKMFLESFYLGSEALMNLAESQELERENQCFDQNFIKNFILRTLHLLYASNKFEKFIHITLRFTKITKYHFVDITHPLLIQCQQSLLQMAKDREEQDPNWTEDMSKRHISQTLIDLHWGQIDSSNYGEFLKIRESGMIGRVNLSQHKLSLVKQAQNLGNEATHIKNLMSFLTSQNNVWLLFSVPIDVEVSNYEWKQATFDRDSKRVWREICQKKQLYLYQQNMNKSDGISSVSFNYIKQSYKEAIEMFKCDGNKEYCGLLQRDLGDLLANNGDNYIKAIVCWKESLENLLDQKNPLEYLEKLLTNGSGNVIDSIHDTEKLASKYGILRCLEIGAVLSRISRYGDFSTDKRTILCLYTSIFYKAVYGTSLSNSNCDNSYLDQCLSLDSVNPVPLLIKLHITSDQSRNDMQDIESQLWFLIEELRQARYHQFSLPLMALYEHIVSTYFRNSQKCTRIRILKLEVAIELRQFGIASRILFQLLTGDRLPQQLDSQMAQSISKTISEVYDDRKHILEDNNVTVLDRIMSRRLNANIAQKIGLTLTNRISILQAKFLLEVASNVNGDPQAMESKTTCSTEQHPISKKSVVKKTETISGQSEELESILEQVSSKMQWESPKQITLLQLKGLLLQVASGILQPIIGDILVSLQKENPNVWKVARYEDANVISGLLVQAKICRQLHHNRSGARLAMFACRVLDGIDRDGDSVSSDVCREELGLNVRLHLRCNQEIVKCLLGEVGIGQIMEFSKTAITDVPDLKALILSSISECDENFLWQSKAWFIAALSKYSLFSGYEAKKYHEILKESLSVLKEEMILTEESKYLYDECRLQEINFNLTSDKTVSIEYLEKQIITVHDDIMRQLDKKYPQSVFWNARDPGQTVLRVCNKYDRQYDQVSRLKLLLATALVDKSKLSIDISNERLRIINILNSGLDIVRTISNRKPWVEVELLMMLGRLQRYLIMPKKVTATTAISTLAEGLKLSISSSGHMGIQKQFFLELALTFMQSSRLNSASFNDKGEIISDADFSARVAQSQMKIKANEISAEVTQYNKLSWLALRCAGHITNCMRQRSHIKSDSSRLLLSENVQKLPISICFDLYGRCLLGDKRIIFKNEIEEELSRMPEARIPRHSEHLDDQIERIRQSAPVLNWSQLLCYQEMVVKITNNQFLTTTQEDKSAMAALTRRMSSFSEIFSKEFEVHKFLKAELPDYRTKCVPFVPKDILQFSSLNTREGIMDEGIVVLTEGPLNEGRRADDDTTRTNDMKLIYPYHPSLLEDVEMKDTDVLERMDVNEIDFSLDMFSPPFEFSLHAQEMTILLYSCSKKLPKNANKSDSIITGWRMVPTSQLSQVYENLQETAHHLEVVSSNSDVPPPTKSGESQKKASLAVNNKVTKTVNSSTILGPGSEISDIEMTLRRTFDTIVCWTHAEVSQTFSPPKEMLTKVSLNSYSMGDNSVTLNNIPFELNVDNVRTLAHLFNPIHSKNIINNATLTKFILDSLKIDFL